MSRAPRSGRILLMALLVLGCGVELVHTAGWWRWRALAALVREDAGAAAAALAAPRGPGWLPPEAVASRRLPAEALKPAGPTAAAAWERLGRRQRRFMPTDPEGAESAARAEALAGDPSVALAWTAQAIRRDPTDPYQRRVAAVLELRGGSYERALEQLAQAEAAAPNSTRAIQVLPGDDEWVRLEGLRRRIELYPRDAVRTRLALAAALRRLGRTSAAEAALAPVADEPEAVLNRAAWALQDGQPAAAEALAGPLAEMRWLPASLRARALSVQAQARQAQGDGAGAAAAAAHALRLAPGSPAPYLALASIAEKRGDHARALEHLRRAWGLAPGDVGVILRFARGAERAQRGDDALLALERAAALAPERPEVAAMLVEHLLDRGLRLEATLRLSEALDRHPSNRRLVGLAERIRREGSPPVRR